MADGSAWKMKGSNAPQTLSVRVPPDLREDSFTVVYEISNRIGAVQYSSVDEDDLAPKDFYQLQIRKETPIMVRIPGPIQISHGNYERNGQDYAVLFATDIYEDKQVFPQLEHPISDATKIKGALERYGFEVELYANPTLQDIGNVLGTWRNRTYAPDDQLLVYFAGHGHYDDIDGYLAATDSKGPDVDIDYTTYYAYKRLKERLDSIPCPNILLIVDADYSGNISPDVQNSLREKFGSNPVIRNLKEVYEGPNRQRRIKERVNAKTRWYLTVGGNEPVPDDSVFTKAFLKALDDTLQDKAGNDKVLTIEEIEFTFHKMLTEENQPHSPETGAFGDNKDDRGFLFIAPAALSR